MDTPKTIRAVGYHRDGQGRPVVRETVRAVRNDASAATPNDEWLLVRENYKSRSDWHGNATAFKG